MKHKLILEFPKLLYNKLASNNQLNQMVSGIFSYVPKDTKFPYIYIGKMSAIDWSTKSSQGIQLLFNVHLFSQAQTNKEILEILSLLNDYLDKWEVKLGNRYFVSVKLIASDIEQESDVVAFHAISRFKTNIEELQ